MNDHVVSALLSKRQLTQLHYAVMAMKREREQLTIRHTVISKYHRRLWFQRSMQKTVDQLMEEYYSLAKVLDGLDEDIGNCEYLIHQHHIAVEELHESMNPFKGIDLRNTDLIQLPLF